ncbi:hypothetical protein GCM10025734_75510 [Kitasatospora paranensis]
MDGQLERQPAAEQQRPVQQQHAARPEHRVRRAGGPVGGGVPERGQHPSAAARVERGEDLAQQGAVVQPEVVEGVGVVPPVLQAQRGGAQEVGGGDPQHGVPAQPERVDQGVREGARTGGGRPVHGDPHPGGAALGDVRGPVGDQRGQPLRGDRFGPHPVVLLFCQVDYIARELTNPYQG